MAAAQRDLFAGYQGHQVLAAERSSQLVNAVSIHDDRAVDPDKVAFRQPRRHCAQLFAYAVMCFSRMHAHIVS